MQWVRLRLLWLAAAAAAAPVALAAAAPRQFGTSGWTGRDGAERATDGGGTSGGPEGPGRDERRPGTSGGAGRDGA